MSNKTSDKNVGSIEDDVKRCNELIKVEHANWIGISNQLAISHILAEREQKNKRIQELEHLNISFEKGIKRLKKKIKEVEGVNKEEVAKMTAERLQKDYILKQVVIDKMKENKQILAKTNDGNLRERLYIENGIMKELLEGEK